VKMQEHPSEIELLELVEGELDGPEKAAVEAHVTSCLRCAASVAELEQGRAALRGAPLFELPAERRSAIFASLGAQERDRSRRLAFLSSPRQLALVAVPVAAAVATAVTISVTGGNGSPGATDEAAAQPLAEEHASRTAAAPPAGRAEASTPAPSGGAAAAGTTGAALDTAPVTAASAPTRIRALGAATDVADALERAGVHVDRILDRQVEVTGDPDAVRAALAGRLAAPGQQAVVVVVLSPAEG
jgi:hypothetical protein